MKQLSFCLLSISVFAFLIAGFLHPVTAFTQDLGRHLLMGEIITKTLNVPKTNLLSYTYPEFPFINHHYFSEVLFYLINQVSGTNGLLIIMTTIVLLAFGIVFLYSAKKWSILPVSFLSFFYLKVLFERTDLRPEMFGYLLLSIFVVLLYTFREKYSKWILLLIPLTFLWVQIHISFVIGLVVIGLFFIDNMILHRKKLNNPSTRLLLITLLSSTLVIILNPNGLAGALYPLHIFQNYGYTIEENQNIFFLESLFFKPTIPYFKLSVLLLFLSLFSVLKKTRPIDWLLAITFTYLAASAVRNFPLFVFATFIPASFALSTAWIWITDQIPNKRVPTITFTLSVLVGLLFLWQIPSIAALRGFGLGVTSGAEKAADFYVTHHLKGPVFNNFDIGSYLAYRVYPEQKVFIDGRPEAYPASFIQKTYIPMQENPQLFAEKEKQYHFNSIFFAHTDQTPWAATFLQWIMQDSSWVPVYLDHDVIILVKDNEENKELITKYGMKKENMIVKDLNTYSIRELMLLINFYIPLQMNKEVMETVKLILTNDPRNCQVLSFALSNLSQNSIDPLYSVYARNYTTFCR